MDRTPDWPIAIEGIRGHSVDAARTCNAHARRIELKFFSNEKREINVLKTIKEKVLLLPIYQTGAAGSSFIAIGMQAVVALSHCASTRFKHKRCLSSTRINYVHLYERKK